MSEYTLLLTDLVDSTALVERLGDARAAELWTDHDRRARQLLAQHDGLEIDRSDGFFLLFNRAEDAVRFASAYHRLVGELGLAARVGVHVGPVTLRRNLPDEVVRGAKPIEVEGLAKPLAARIMALSGGGRTLLSADAAAALDAAALEGQVLHRHGHYRVKGIEEPVEIAELTPPSAACTPPVDGDKAYRVVRVGELWRPVREVPHNLVPERDAFVGRQADLRRLAEQLESGTRLLTLLGPGGTGKTRLVRRYAMAWLGEWPGGVYFCDLSEARDLQGIHLAVALALGVPLSQGDAGAQLGHAIAGRGRCLVILDNFEQVQALAQASVGQWLDRAAQASFVVTSRERLHLAGEVVAALDPLALADDAIALFAARARAQQRDFAIDADNRGAVAEIVRLLDGLPLAIELAAARVRVLSPAQIVERLRDRFQLLAGGDATTARQTTLRATIDWSWDLLSAPEQAALAQSSVFDGGFTLEAAEAVVDLSGRPDAPPVIDVLQALVDKSMLLAWLPKGDGRLAEVPPYFGFHFSILEYASHRLRAGGAAAAAQSRHGRHFARLGSEAGIDALLVHGGQRRRQLLALELDNLVSGCRRALSAPDPPTAAACFLGAWAVLATQGPFELVVALGRDVAALADLEPRQRVRVLLALSAAARELGDAGTFEEAIEQALAIAQAARDRKAEGLTLGRMAVDLHDRGAMDDAERLYRDAAARLDLPDGAADRATVLSNLAGLHFERGRIDAAEAAFGAALELQREVGNRYAEGILLGNLGALLFDTGRVEPARRAYTDALAIHREGRALLQEAITLGNLGNLVRYEGKLAEAEAINGLALDILRRIGSRFNEGVVIGQIGDIHQALGRLESADEHYRLALRIHREVGNRRFEGGVLGSLGVLQAAQGRADDALRSLLDGERLLREVDDPLALAKLLCQKSRVVLAAGDSDTAGRSLGEAESIARSLGAAPGSELGTEIEAVRAALG